MIENRETLALEEGVVLEVNTYMYRLIMQYKDE
jgi:hypothetical protein